MALNSTTNMETSLKDLEDKFEKLYDDMNAFFIITMGCLVFLMQGGFAFLEAGAVR